MRQPPLATLEGAHGMDGQSGNRRELFLREGCRLAQSFQLRAKGL
jgi:hypothetical protein